jgi:hypothetical protein
MAETPLDIAGGGRASGILLRPSRAHSWYAAGALIATSADCTSFFFANGGYRDSNGSAEFIDYGSGRVERRDVSTYRGPPTELPKSDTHGLAELDVQSNLWGNLPAVPQSYVERPALQSELDTRLRDKNHTIITLHGAGGVGKTSLALYVAHAFASEDDPLFEHILWFSARDVELRPTGPTRVKPAVVDLTTVCRAYGDLFNTETSTDDLARVLREPDGNGKGSLFIFDNFESIVEARDLHEFLDTHTHMPNKVLITSRERSFKADYPIEIRGMERAEAGRMLHNVAAELGLTLSARDVEGIYEFSHGHAYVMRILVGEIAKEGRYVPPKSLLPGRTDIIDAVFERSFDRLTDAGRRVFLVVANWQSSISELALIVVLGEHETHVLDGIDECLRLSLLVRDYMSDGTASYTAPQLARSFAKRKLIGDPDLLTIREDIALLQSFGVMGRSRASGETQEQIVRRFVEKVKAREAPDEARRVRLDRMLAAVAEYWPPAWRDLAQLRIRWSFSQEQIEYALRRAVEEQPFEPGAWLDRANYAATVGDEKTEIASLVSASEANPTDVDFLLAVATRLVKYVMAHKAELPERRRGALLASVRSRLEEHARELHSDALSRLAWLFLLEGDRAHARSYALAGLDKEPGNKYCQNLIDRISS